MEVQRQIEDFTNRGYVIIPLNDKIPVQKEWQNIKWNPEIPHELLEKYTSFGFQIPDEIVVIDVDNHDEENLGSQSIKKLSSDFNYDFEANAGFIVNTASDGLHLYYKIPKGAFKIKNSLKAYPGIEFKSKGKQVVIPGSKLSNGKSYQLDALSCTLDDIKDLPTTLLSQLQKEVISTPNKSSNLTSTDEPCDIIAFKNYLDSRPEILAGNRNNALYPIACKALNFGLSREVAIEHLSEWQLTKVLPPLDLEELSSIVTNAYNYSKEKNGIDSIAQIFEKSPDPKSLNVVNIAEFLSMQLPERDCIIEPILATQGLAMIYAARGVGKTYLSLFLSLSIANGSNVFGEKWKVSKPCKVLYIDGEMSAKEMQMRIKKFNISPKDPDNFKILTRDLLGEKSMPNLAIESDQKILEKYIEDRDVIIIDNISTLCVSGKENEAESWRPTQLWALLQRSRGKSIIFIHHAGKGGNQRGTSHREDILDTVIKLQHPENYDRTQGARFEVHFEKTRSFAGEHARAFELNFEETKDGLAQWKIDNITNDKSVEEEEVIRLSNQGFTQFKIAKELGLSQTKVSLILKEVKTKAKTVKEVFSN